MSGRWVKSLPHPIGSDAHSAAAVTYLGDALEYQSLGYDDELLTSIQWAAAHVRAWRLSLPTGQQFLRMDPPVAGLSDRYLLHLAIRDIVYADAALSGEMCDKDNPLNVRPPGVYLRGAEADLRVLGKRLMDRVES